MFSGRQMDLCLVIFIIGLPCPPCFVLIVYPILQLAFSMLDRNACLTFFFFLCLFPWQIFAILLGPVLEDTYDYAAIMC